MLKNKKIFVLGMARSGYEAAKLLATDNEVLITDMKEQDEEQVKTLQSMGVKYIISQSFSFNCCIVNSRLWLVDI